MLERVIEEQAKGDPARAEAVREAVREKVGDDLSTVEPGSEAAEELKLRLIELGVWSQYLEVGIGPLCRNLHEMPTYGGGRHRCNDWPPPRFGLE